MFKFIKNRFSKFKAALSKTRSALTDRIKTLFQGPWDEETFEKLEQILFEADLGTDTAFDLVAKTRSYLKTNKTATIDDILAHLQNEATALLKTTPPLPPPQKPPEVILIVGVNGSGKTTSIAKIARKLQQEGKSVMLAAGDTFRAAAIDQLTTWAERLGTPIIKSTPGGDPAAVAFDALESALAKGVDTVIIDTAGRLQNKTDLMRELEKIHRVMKNVIPEAPHKTLLVLDATTGQNALDQAEVFHSFTPLSGLILTKLDGSAKGGIVLSIYKKLGIPIEWIGVGEGMDDLMPFDPEAFTDALFSPS